MDNQQATDAELGWLAGIIDGEGYITIAVQTKQASRYGKDSRESVSIRITIVNTDPEIVVKAQDIMRKLESEPRIRQSGGVPPRKITYEAQISNMSKAKRLLLAVKPYLTGNKAARAELVLRFIASREGKKWSHNSYTDEEKELIQSVQALVG